MNLLKDMLLIQEPSIFKLSIEMIQLCQYFIAPCFTISLILEYLGEMNFTLSVKKLFIVILMMSFFYEIHSSATHKSLDIADATLKKIDKNNFFMKKWYEVKVKTKEKSSWGIIEKLAIPNLNDIVATFFYLMSKVFIWLLKLIYSTVYHLTYVFVGISSLLYFFHWTEGALKGAIKASLWCMLMPFVLIAILALVGNSFEHSSDSGEFIIGKVDNIIWLFGITLMLLITPLITYSMINGDGIHSFGSKFGQMLVSTGMKASVLIPIMNQFRMSLISQMKRRQM